MAQQTRRFKQIRFLTLALAVATPTLIDCPNHPLRAEQKLTAHPAAPAGINASPPPEFAKRVQVKLADRTESLADVIRQNAADSQLANYRDLRAAESDTA